MNQPVYDLHTHSTYSDGELTPLELAKAASAAGVAVLALTDHDSVEGLSEAKQACFELGMGFVPGAEISAEFKLTKKVSLVVHVVGLYFKDTQVLAQRLQLIGEGRAQRAKQICAKLEQLLGVDVYPKVLELASNQPSAVTRSHVARALLEAQKVSKLQKAFDLYLANNKPAYVALESPTLAEVIEWIHEAGGVSVLAHPTRYGLSSTNTRKLIDAFAASGGQAVELCKDSEPPGTKDMINMKIKEHELLVSTASDFHGACMPWNKLGSVPQLKEGQTGVWASQS